MPFAISFATRRPKARLSQGTGRIMRGNADASRQDRDQGCKAAPPEKVEASLRRHAPAPSGQDDGKRDAGDAEILPNHIGDKTAPWAEKILYRAGRSRVEGSVFGNIGHNRDGQKEGEENDRAAFDPRE